MPPSKVARIISLNSQKGGVGKTTSAIHLSKGLALGGYRTLLMDIDPQGSVQSALRVERQSRAGSYELFCVPGTRLEDVCQPSGSQNLDLVLANAREMREEHEINRVAGDYYFLSQWIDEHALDHYDFIILDSPATTGVLSINVMLAANLIVVPLQCQALAVKSLKRFLGAFRDLQKSINPSLRLAGILLTMYDKNTPAHRYIGKQIYQKLGESVFETIIPHCSRIQDMSVIGGDVIQGGFRSVGATGYIQFTNEILDRFDLRLPGLTMIPTVRILDGRANPVPV